MSEKDNKIVIPDTNYTKYVIQGMLIIVVMFGIITTWAAYAPLATTSVAVGKVIPSTATVPIQHLRGGIIETIYVKDGDIVEANETIVKLRDIDYKEKLKALTNQYQELLARKDRLKSEIDNKDSVIFSDGISNNIKSSELKIFKSTKNSIKTKEELTNSQVKQYKEDIRGNKSLLESKKSRLKSVVKELSEQESLFKEHLVGKQKLVELKKERDSLKGDIDNLKSTIDRKKEQINEIKNQLELFKKDLKNKNLKELTDVKSKIVNIESDITSLKDKLDRVDIKTPISGIVMGIDKHAKDEVVKPGDTICEIIPKGTKLIIEAQISSIDIDKMKNGLEADLSFPSLDMRKLPHIKGHLIYVSANSVLDKQRGVSYYIGKIDISKEGLEILKRYKQPLIVGMPAVAMIRTGERTLLEYLIKPLKEMAQRSFNEE